MMRRTAVIACLVCLVIGGVATTLPAIVSVYPTGTTVYDPAKTWSGYTIFGTPEEQGAVLVDMNGAVVNQWTQIAFVPGPIRMLPGGYVMGAHVDIKRRRGTAYQAGKGNRPTSQRQHPLRLG